MSNEPEVKIALGNRVKMSRILVYKIVEKAFLAEFTWTGRSIGDRVKMKFKELVNINRLLYSVVSNIDVNYDRKTFSEHLISRILKYAYE